MLSCGRVSRSKKSQENVPAPREQLADRVALSVRQLIAGAILFNQKVADDAGMNLRDMQVIHLLQLQGPLTPRVLSERACVTTGGMTVILDRLEKAGFVRRQPNPDDRRSSIVHLIPESLRKLERVYRSQSDALFRVIEQYDERDLRVLAGFLERLNGASA